MAACDGVSYTFTFYYNQSAASTGSGSIGYILFTEYDGYGSEFLQGTINLYGDGAPDSNGGTPGEWNMYLVRHQLALSSKYLAQLREQELP